jgi:hypothetical protein
MMPAVSILGAAGESDGRHAALGGIQVSTELLSPDPAANLMLRLAAALLQRLPSDARANTGLVIGTAQGSLAADLEFDRSRREMGGRYASPAAFSRTLPSAVATALSVNLQLRGPLLTVLSAENCATLALRRAAAWMHHFHLHYCLAGAVEQPLASDPQRVSGALLLLARGDDAHGGVAAGRLTISERGVERAAASDESGAGVDDALHLLLSSIGRPRTMELPGKWGVQLWPGA